MLIQNILYRVICEFLEDPFVIWVYTNAYFKLCVCVCVCGLPAPEYKTHRREPGIFSHVSEHDGIETTITGQKGKVLHVVQPTLHSKLYSLLAR